MDLLDIYYSPFSLEKMRDRLLAAEQEPLVLKKPKKPKAKPKKKKLSLAELIAKTALEMEEQNEAN